MALPAQPEVLIRLGVGSAFGDVLILGDTVNGILGTNILGSNTAQIVDISSTVTSISIRRGRDRMFDKYTPGTAVIRFQDFTGDWNPENTASPYYGQILPMRQVQISTTYSGTGYGLYTGFISSLNWTWKDAAADYAEVTIQCVDGFRLLALCNVNTVPGSTAGQLPGPRIDDILDAVSWPTQLRAISTGDTALLADPGTARTALAAIQTIETSDVGAFFMDANGKATYFSRLELATKATENRTLFNDNGTDIAYQELDIDLDDTELANQVSFTRAGGTAQIVSNAQSISDYFLRTYAQSNLMMETDDLALRRATSVLYYKEQPRLRVDSMTLDLSSVSNRVIPGLSLDIGDPIQITRTVANGTSLVARVQINGIKHDITPDRWRTKFSTAYPLSEAFILGSAEFGILGTSTL